jgi:hypothetical protein
MNNMLRAALAGLGGLVLGFIVFEIIVRFCFRVMEQVPIALIGTLSTLLPLGGAVAAVLVSAAGKGKRTS